MHKVLVNRLGGLSLPRKSVVRLTDRPDMTLDVYCGRKTTIQQQLANDSKIRKQKTGENSDLQYYLQSSIVADKIDSVKYHVQSNFNDSNTFGTMKISSRQG